MNDKNFLKIAHRGYSERYPENTLLAFRRAMEVGADMIELDVHLSRDAYLVVLHDDYIDRTSNGSGMVRNFRLEELRSYNFNYGMKEFGFIKIPLLEEVIDLTRGRITYRVK